MSNKLVLHIGFPKTGTTSLQTWLDLNSTQLENYRIRYYPSFRHNGSAHHQLGIYAKNHNWALIKNVFAENKSSKSDEIDVISTESLTSLSDHEIKKLYKVLYEFYDEILIYATTRLSYSLIKSQHGQQIREGFIYSNIEEFSIKALNHANFLYLKDSLEPWSSNNKNNKNNVYIRIIEKNIDGFDGDSIHNFINTFFETKKIDIKKFNKSSKNSNTSLSSAQIEYLRLMHNHIKYLWQDDVNWDLRRYVYFCFSNIDKDFIQLKDFEDQSTQKFMIKLLKNLILDKEKELRKLNNDFNILMPSNLMITNFYKDSIIKIKNSNNLIDKSSIKYKFTTNQKDLIDDLLNFYKSKDIYNLGPSQQLFEYRKYKNPN